ncbi:chorismate synthase [Eubacterium sp.]|uniref:chorismate synthase n=1 Tax=Eubacterium sp. TaxID=142586 RepID=UPI0025ED0517|nr:chorismate synthase [Eubacterium sp.]MDY3812293.1 chorismate synthase [Eubacterium sp.]MDY5242851.1 chorismate synthase [Eubacterium sp.]
MSSVIGDKIKLSIFGESHGEAIGCVIDGLPAGIKIDMNAVYKDMQRRAPGKDKTATPRLEKDIPHILSGMLDNVTTGAPLAMVIENTNTKSGDYSNLMTVPRPGHSDYPAYVKYGGNNDIRGGGHFSGRLTAPLVFAGSVAKQILSQMGVTIGAHIKQIGSVCDAVSDLNKTDKSLLDTLSSSTFSLIDETKEQAMRDEIEKARLSLDSVGGIIECFAVGLPVGLGGNMFDTVEGKLASILFGVPAVKGVEFGIGFGFADKRASEVNDQYEIKNGRVATLSNNNGGVLGGMTDGAPLSVSVAIKPTPSIAKKQKSVNLLTMENAELEIHGRHDPCIVVRAVPVIECAVALGLLDLMM